MPIIETRAFGPQPAARTASAARRRGFHSADAAGGMERQGGAQTAHLYERVKNIPSVEWPFFAPHISAINRLKKEQRGHPGA